MSPDGIGHCGTFDTFFEGIKLPEDWMDVEDVEE